MMKKISYPMGQHTICDFSMTFLILMELQKEKAIRSFCVDKNRIEIELLDMDNVQKITAEDVNELLKLLCRKGTYVSLFIDIHDGEIKQVDNRWKSRAKEEIADFIKKFGKKEG